MGVLLVMIAVSGRSYCLRPAFVVMGIMKSSTACTSWSFQTDSVLPGLLAVTGANASRAAGV